MKARRLVETLELALVVEPNLDIVTDNMVAEWGASPYSQLSVLLVNLRYLYHVHQLHHWISKGDPFYGDHLLFQRLYESTLEDIDSVAEKAIGLGSTSAVDLSLQMAQLGRMTKEYGMTATVRHMSELARRSYLAEMNFLKIAAHLAEDLKECGRMTRGLDNLLAGIEDKHESNVYLLKQRVQAQ